MRQHRRDTSTKQATRVYALLLRLYPRAHRQAFGEQMLQAFRDHYRDAVETGAESELEFWLGVASDEGKSLLREHLAALAERRPSMKKLFPAIWAPVTVVAALALLGVLLDLAHMNNIVPLLMAIPIYAIPIYLALLFLVVRLARSLPRSHGNRSWWQLGLLLGGIIGLYMVALNLLDALAPIPGLQNRYGDNVGPVWLLTLPLLAGAVGVVGGYVGGRMRTGVAAGMLSGGIMLCMQIASTVLLVVALWHVLQANALHSQLQVGTQDWIQHQWSIQHPGVAPSLWTYLTNLNDDASIAFGIVYKSAYTVIAWLIPVIAGSAIGARAVWQVRDTPGSTVAAQGPARARSSSRFTGFTALLFAFGILIWSGFTVAAGASYAGASRGGLPFLLSFLGASFVTPAFFAWLLVFMAVLVAVLVTGRPVPTQLSASAS